MTVTNSNQPAQGRSQGEQGISLASGGFPVAWLLTKAFEAAGIHMEGMEKAINTAMASAAGQMQSPAKPGPTPVAQEKGSGQELS